jgi:hypothetical protein
MRIEQNLWSTEKGWLHPGGGTLKDKAQLAFVFGATDLLKNPEHFAEIKKMVPSVPILGCSTSGEIFGTQVFDNTISLTTVFFEKSTIQGAQIDLTDIRSSFEAGERLARAIDRDGLLHAFVLSDGLQINGSELVDGLLKHLPGNITVTGGLAGDGARFGETLVFWDDVPQKQRVAIVGFYGSHLKIGYGSLGGWDPFGPERLITRSKENVLFELDDQSALEVYKRYLGEHAKGLPATGLLFPLSIRTKSGESGIVRTILSVNEEEQSMTFAGDVPEGAYARFMKANFERLIDGAQGAAKTGFQAVGSISPDLAILISCVGRKLILKQRTEEEVEAAQDILGKKTIVSGFYSYGEISPFTPGAKCALHNQTMTITLFSES